MTALLKRGLFVAFLLCFSLTTNGLSFDKRTSVALSHYIMATLYEQAQEFNRALGEYQKVLRLDYQSPLLHLNVAALHIKNNNIPKAIEELNIAAKLTPQAVEPHALLALLYSSQSQEELATKEYELALKNASLLQPNNVDIYKTLGTIYLHQKRYKEAENTYRLILQLAPEDAEAHFYLANIYEELKERPKAEAELKGALRIKPDYHEALNFLGYLYAQDNKNLDEAEEMIQKALKAQPDNGAYVDSLGWVYFRKGKFKEALKELERAATLLDDQEIYDHLGDAYFKLNEAQKAKMSWQKSLELDPEQKEVKEKLEKVK